MIFALVALNHLVLVSEVKGDPTGLGPGPGSGGGRSWTYSYREARQLLDQQRWEEAISVFGFLVQQQPLSVPYATGLATAYVHAGRRESALTLLIDTSQRLKGTDRKGIIRKTRVLSRVFLTNKTFQVYQDGINLMAVKKYRGAREKFEKALSDEPNNVEILTRLGQCQVLDSDYPAAVTYLTEAKKMNPFEPEISLWLGRAKFLGGGGSKATGDLWEAFDLLKGSELAATWLAETLWSTGQGNVAFRILETDIKDWPFHLSSLVMIARLRLQTAHAGQDTQTLWNARKNLQLAMSRMDSYNENPSGPDTDSDGSFNVDLRRSKDDLKGEIQRLLQQVQNKLEGSNP